MRPSEVAEMMIVTHVDELERRSVIQVPEGTPETRWGQGILVGPPDLSALGLPEEVTTRLHNELFHRGIVGVTRNCVVQRCKPHCLQP
jgi:hypothetical protein